MKNQLFEKPHDDVRLLESRRQFLKTIAYGAVLALSGCGTETPPVHVSDGLGITNPHRQRFRHRPGDRTLSFEHGHTGERLKLTYYEKGVYVDDALKEINYLLRDFHTGNIHPIDTELLDQLYDVKETLGFRKPFHILSAYRSPYTNAKLRRHSRGVAEHSYHMKGRAIDIRVEGVSCKAIRNTALAMAQGGVGYYPRSNFVHLDTGRVRTW